MPSNTPSLATPRIQPPARGAWFRPRLPLLLYSYIASEMLAPFFASFIILYCVFFLIRLIPLLEVVLALRIGFADFIRLFSYIFPHMLLYVIPMASMAGVIIGFTRLTNDREILALKACGISLRQMLPPLIVMAAAIALLTGYFSIRLIPAGELGFKQLMFQLAKEKIDKGLKEKEFTEALGDLVVYVDEIDEQRNWKGVFVSDMRGRQQPLITMAKSGRMSADMENMMVTIVLANGTMHNADGYDNQVLQFKNYQLQIPLRPPTKVDGDDVTALTRGSMTQQQLVQVAKRYGKHKTRKGRVYLSEYHHRLVLPVGCFILSLLGLPLGLQAGPGKRAVGIPLGLAFFIFFYITFTITRVMSEDGVLPLVLGMWLPIPLFAGLTLYIFWRVDREQPLIPERWQNAIMAVFDRYLRPTLTRALTRARALFDRWIRQNELINRWIVQKFRPVSKTSAARSPHLMVHADSTTGLYHLPGCEFYDCPNCRIEFKDITIAKEAGFEPCGLCATLPENRDQHTTSSN